MEKYKIHELVISAFAMALIFLATWLLKLPNGIQSYVHAGDGFLLAFAAFLSPAHAALAAGIGSALADVAGGYGYFFIFTLCIKGLEAGSAAWLLRHIGQTSGKRILVYLLGSFIMCGGYFLADAWVNESWQLAALGIFGNLLQASFGILLAYLLYPLLQKQMLR